MPPTGGNYIRKGWNGMRNGTELIGLGLGWECIEGRSCLRSHIMNVLEKEIKTLPATMFSPKNEAAEPHATKNKQISD